MRSYSYNCNTAARFSTIIISLKCRCMCLNRYCSHVLRSSLLATSTSSLITLHWTPVLPWLVDPADSAVQSSTGDIASGVALVSLDEVKLLRSSGSQQESQDQYIDRVFQRAHRTAKFSIILLLTPRITQRQHHIGWLVNLAHRFTEREVLRSFCLGTTLGPPDFRVCRKFSCPQSSRAHPVCRASIELSLIWEVSINTAVTAHLSEILPNRGLPILLAPYSHTYDNHTVSNGQVCERLMAKHPRRMEVSSLLLSWCLWLSSAASTSVYV